MYSLFITMLAWWGVGAGLYLAWHLVTDWYSQRQRRKYWQHQPVYGPYRPNLRKVL